MGAPRRQNSAEKRSQVLDATLRVLAREGTRGVTHRAVAAEAGTSLRATTYYFSSRKELLSEALRHYAQAAIQRFDAIRAPLPAQDPIAAAAEMLAATVMSDLEHDRPGLIAEYELVLGLSRDSTLEPVYREWQALLLGILEEYTLFFGSSSPTLHARIVLATLRGLELEALSKPSEQPDPDQLREAFTVLLRALVSDPGQGTK